MNNDDDHNLTVRALSGQAPRAHRRARRGDDPRGGTNGANGVTSGWFKSLGLRLRAVNPIDLKVVFFIVAPVSLIAAAINSSSNLSDIPEIAAWKPWSWEISSLFSILAALVIPWLTTALAPPDEAASEGWRPKAKFLLVHLTGLVLFSALHVVGFVVLRMLMYDLMREGPYVFGDRFFYELRKDLMSYAAYVATFSLVGYWRRVRSELVRPVSFDIRDGARIIRVPLGDIVAVSSAGNYVEFLLVDGRRPLMRATLAAVEVELGEFGFVRAHRSWLVNAGQVTGLKPEGSGDWTIELGAVEVPLSRRYPAALQRLKR